jgi:purine-nucleoside phosphorylase
MKSADALRAEMRESLAHVRSWVDAKPSVGLILGTGLGAIADQIDVSAQLVCDDIPHMPHSTVKSHAGQMVFGTLGGLSVVALQGRNHFYEGYTLQQVVMPVRLLRSLGIDTLIVTAACGGMNPLWNAGDIMMLSDHINLMGDNPLLGPNLDELGPRFPDMSEPYDRVLQSIAEEQALALHIPLRRGVYVAVAGPNLETRAEYRMLRSLGADVVGMSTVPEVIAARHMGVRVLALAVITDQCLPDALEPADIDTIIATAQRAEPQLARLVVRVLEQLH